LKFQSELLSKQLKYKIHTFIISQQLELSPKQLNNIIAAFTITPIITTTTATATTKQKKKEQYAESATFFPK